MTIAITTPTGHVGSHLARIICQAGERPRLLLRDPDHLDPGLRELVDLAVGDQRDAAYVADATEGVDAVYWVHPDDWTLPDPNADAAEAGRGLAEAMRRNRIPRVVFQSSVGAELREGAGFLDGLGAIEEELDAAREESGGALLHLRCGFFMTNLLAELDALKAGTLATTRPLDEPIPWVDPRDIAEVAAARLLSDAWEGRQVQAVHGPADLSWSEAAEAISTGTGKTVEARELTDDEQRELMRGAGMTDTMIDGIIGMSVGKGDGFTPEQPRSALTTTPGTLVGWAVANLLPVL
jgi:uncharacterized protein YbjT (DUF2867 family)